MNGKTRDKKLAINIGSGSVARVASIFLALVQVPIVVTHLGAEGYGFWILCSSLAGWLALSDLGLSNGLLNALSRTFSDSDALGSRSIYSSCIALLVTIALAGSILLALPAFLLPYEDWFHLENIAYRGEARLVIFLSLALPLWSIVADGLTKPYLAIQRHFPLHVTGLLGSILSLLLVILAIRLGGGISAIMAASFAGNTIPRLIAAALIIWERSDHLALSLKLVSFSESRKLLRTGSRFLILSLSWLCIAHVDQIIIGTSLGASHNAAYGLAIKIFGYVMIIPNVIHISLWPAYAEAASRMDFVWIEKRFLQATFASGAIVLLILTGFALVGPALIPLWTRNEVVIDRSILYWMIPYGFVFSCISQITALMNSVERFRPLIIGAVTAAITNVALSVILVKSFAEVGVIAATCVAGTIQILIILPGLRKFLLMKGCDTLPPNQDDGTESAA